MSHFDAASRITTHANICLASLPNVPRHLYGKGMQKKISVIAPLTVGCLPRHGFGLDVNFRLFVMGKISLVVLISVFFFFFVFQKTRSPFPLDSS